MFALMINDALTGVGSGIGVSLYADHRAMWRKGRNVALVMRRIQELVNVVENWALMLGFRDKTCYMVFSKQKVEGCMGRRDIYRLTGGLVQRQQSSGRCNGPLW